MVIHRSVSVVIPILDEVLSLPRLLSRPSASLLKSEMVRLHPTFGSAPESALIE